MQTLTDDKKKSFFNTFVTGSQCICQYLKILGYFQNSQTYINTALNILSEIGVLQLDTEHGTAC